MSVQSSQDYEVKAGLERLEAFDVIGISAVIKDRDTASEVINGLWETFFKDSIGQQIDTRVDDVIYAVYSDYEGDYTKPYRITIGYKVENADIASDQLHHVKVQTDDYAMMSAAGEQPKALIETWEAIWQSDLERSYKTDFEVYGKRFFEEGVHEVLVAVGVEIEK